MAVKNVRLINDLWTSARNFKKDTDDDDLLFHIVKEMDSAKRSKMISDFDYGLLDCYLTDSRKSKFYRMAKLDLFNLTAQANKCHIQAKNNKLDDMSEYYDNVYTGLYRIIRKRRLTDEYDIYFFTSATIAHRKD